MQHEISKETLSEFLQTLYKFEINSLDLFKTKNINNLHNLLNKIFVYTGKCGTKRELNKMTKCIVNILKKVQNKYFKFIGSISGEKEELQIELEGSDADMERSTIIENIHVIFNRICEIILGIIKFTEIFDRRLISRGIQRSNEKLFYLNVNEKIIPEILELIVDTSVIFFKFQREKFISGPNKLTNMSIIDTVVVQDSLIFSFLIFSSIAVHEKHTISMDIDHELMFFLLNYIMNQNTELNHSFLNEFSKVSDLSLMNQRKPEKVKNNGKDCKFEVSKTLLERALSILQIEKFNFKFFLKDQLIKHGTPELIAGILMRKNTHRWIIEMGDFMINRILRGDLVTKAFIETFNPSDYITTKKILEKTFEQNYNNSAEALLKEFIIVNRAVMCKELFFDSCRVLDSAFIDCMMIFSFDFAQLPSEMIVKVTHSYYLPILIENKEAFEKFLIKITQHVQQLKLENPSHSELSTFEQIYTLALKDIHTKKMERKISENYHEMSLDGPKFHISGINIQSDTNTEKVNIILDSMEKCLIFTDMLPETTPLVVNFIKLLLKQLDSVLKDIECDPKYHSSSFKSFNIKTFSSLSLNSPGSSMKIPYSDRSIHPQHKVYQNSENIIRLMNITRFKFSKWDLKTLTRNIDMVLFLKNLIFKEQVVFDTLFFTSLNDTIDLATQDEKESNVSQERITEIISVLFQGLKEIFSSKNDFLVFIIQKNIKLSLLLEIPNLEEKYSQSISQIFSEQQNNFYKAMELNKSGISQSFMTSDRTILHRHPLAQENSLKNTSISKSTLKFSQSNTMDDDEMSMSTNTHNISEIEDSFSMISLTNATLEKKKPILYSDEHFYVDLMSDLQKVTFLNAQNTLQSRDEIVNHCRSRLFKNAIYRPGLAFYSSKVSFLASGTGSLFCNFFQYEPGQDQYLVKFHHSAGVFSLKMTHNAILFVESTSNRNEKMVSCENLSDNKIISGFSFDSKMLYCLINEEQYRFNIGKVKYIEIGVDFKGIIDKILFYQGYKFDSSFKKVMNTSIENYYDKYVRPIEQNCKYYDTFGFFMFQEQPFYLGPVQKKVTVKNVKKIDDFDIKRLIS